MTATQRFSIILIMAFLALPHTFLAQRTSTTTSTKTRVANAIICQPYYPTSSEGSLYPREIRYPDGMDLTDARKFSMFSRSSVYTQGA
jgi:hypothetical protein